MRWLATIIVLVGCTGERVEPVTADTGGADSVADVGETPDTTAEAAPDSADAACPKYAKNLIPDGDFSTGFGAWRPSDCLLEAVPGPCGKALHMYGMKGQARATATYAGVPVSAGTKLHLRAWFKKGTDLPPTTAPMIRLRSYAVGADGGTVSEDFVLNGTLTDEWRLAERVFTMPHDQTDFEAMVDQFLDPSTETHDFMVADISLVAE